MVKGNERNDILICTMQSKHFQYFTNYPELQKSVFLMFKTPKHPIMTSIIYG